ncbi:MAG TPA: hypothetical protein VME70_05315 [Mycobacteriales bacterium]|nr:hypothetical protein [Mycobacteriales bacterium]
MNDGHLSFDELAELDEELLDPQQAAQARAHLAGCEQCRGQLELIAEARRALAELPPEPMPEDVAARLDRVIAEQTTPNRDVVPDLSAYRRRRFSRPTMAGSVAAAVIILAVVALVVGHLGTGTSSGGGAGGTSTAAKGLAGVPQVAQPRNYSKNETGTNYTPSRLDAIIPGLVARVPADFGPENSPGTGAAPATTTAPAPVASPSQVHGGSQVTERVPDVLRPLLDSRSKILLCAAKLTGNSNAVPITVDAGTWTSGSLHKVPSAVFVMRDKDPNVVDVYVVNPTCSGSLFIRTYVKVPLN